MSPTFTKGLLKGAALAVAGAAALGAGSAQAITNCTLSTLGSTSCTSFTSGFFDISNISTGPSDTYTTGQIAFDGTSTPSSLGVTFSPGTAQASSPGSFQFDVTINDPGRFFSSGITSIFGSGTTTFVSPTPAGNSILPSTTLSFNAFDVTSGTFVVNYGASGTANTAFGANATLFTDVPVPLPVVGAGLAFGFTRKLRKRAKSLV